MDPISQGAVGAALPQSIAPSKQNTRYLLLAGILGFLSGMTPDLDYFIRSSEDPLLFLEYHRQFSHSLIFIPLGGFLCSLLAWSFFKVCFKAPPIPFKTTLLYCTLGYATHSLLDSCTSYGTQLFWPFSNNRVSWNTISIIDPLFTLPVLALVITAAIKNSAFFARLALLWVFFYMSLGLFNQHRAEQKAWQLAELRQHKVLRLSAKPTFGNIILWKVIYETDRHFHMDPIRTGLDIKVYYGDSLPKLNVEKDFPWLDKNSQQAKDIKRFAWFSQDYLVLNPENSKQIMDARYSPTPNRFYPLWLIEVSESKGPSEYIVYRETRRHTEADKKEFREMLLGK